MTLRPLDFEKTQAPLEGPARPGRHRQQLRGSDTRRPRQRGARRPATKPRRSLSGPPRAWLLGASLAHRGQGLLSPPPPHVPSTSPSQGPRRNQASPARCRMRAEKHRRTHRLGRTPPGMRLGGQRGPCWGTQPATSRPLLSPAWAWPPALGGRGAVGTAGLPTSVRQGCPHLCPHPWLHGVGGRDSPCPRAFLPRRVGRERRDTGRNKSSAIRRTPEPDGHRAPYVHRHIRTASRGRAHALPVRDQDTTDEMIPHSPAPGAEQVRSAAWGPRDRLTRGPTSDGTCTPRAVAQSHRPVEDDVACLLRCS